LLTRNVLGYELARCIPCELRVAGLVMFAETVDGRVHHAYALNGVITSVKLKLWDRGHSNQITSVGPQKGQISQISRDIGWIPKDQSCLDGE
jgi:hypothetical protein